MIEAGDWAAIHDVLSRYVWLIDGGDHEGWAALWTEDGVLTGRGEVRGRAALAALAATQTGKYGGDMRHLMSNLDCSYAESRDVVRARFYSHVSLLGVHAEDYGIALCHAELVRQGGEWKIRANDLDIRGPKGNQR
jgi:hypothetical protein